jgi:subtilisin family serine protease
MRAALGVPRRVNALDMVRLTPLMEHTSGHADLMIGLLDGPVAADHPDLADARIHPAPGAPPDACSQANSTACQHGTFVAGVLCARRDSPAPAICPGCTLLVRPIFPDTAPADNGLPSAAPAELAAAITASVAAGARVLNLSLGLVGPSARGLPALREALDLATRRGVLVIAAAGNQGTVGGSEITRHPGVVPVVAYDRHGRPLDGSNLGATIGRRGLGAPGEGVTSLGASGAPLTLAGTSAAAPFVTGAVGLLWSVFPQATAADVKRAVTQAGGTRRTAIVPPLLDAWAAYQALATAYRGR